MTIIEQELGPGAGGEACSCGFVAPEGCACGFLDTDSVIWTKVAGQESQRRASPRIDPRSDSILSCGASGLLAKLPTRFLTRPEFRIYRSTDQSIGNDTPTTITYSSTSFDTDNMFTGPSDDVFINTAGFWLISASVRWTGDADGWRDLALLLNGTSGITLARDFFYAENAVQHANHASAVYRFEATDFLNVQVHHTAGAALNTLAANGTTTNSYNTFCGIFLGDL